MSTPEPYFDGQKWWYSKASYENVKQSKDRAAKARHNAEVERLRRLGVDEAWLERVTRTGAAAAEGGAR